MKDPFVEDISHLPQLVHSFTNPGMKFGDCGSSFVNPSNLIINVCIIFIWSGVYCPCCGFNRVFIVLNARFIW